jgi:N-methylhydantoinase A
MALDLAPYGIRVNALIPGSIDSQGMSPEMKRERGASIPFGRVANGIEAVAIAFLNSFADPSAEREARAIIQRAAPGMRVSISSEVVPEIREFERTSTTIANVYVQDRVAKYLRELQARLERIGFTGSLFLILSSGGIVTVDTAMRFPVRLLESGPAGGALAAANYGASCGYDDLLSFDMGGTTAKFCIIDRGQPPGEVPQGYEYNSRKK